MAATETQLEVVISAIDNASATLKAMAANVTESQGQVAASSEEAGVSFGGLTGSIITAQAAYMALYSAYDSVKEFFSNSINDAIQASATMAQVKVDVANAGLSYSTVGPQIDAVAQKNIAFGFTAEDTSLSMGKLVLATGDYSDALKLNQLAMDLSRAKGIDLNSSTVLIQQVMAGNTRALKQYGISLDSATTSGEALDMLQQKLQGSAAAFADTSAGKLAEVQAQWQQIQIQVGDQLMPIVEELFSAFEDNLPTIKSDLDDLTSAINDTVQFIKDLVSYWQQFWELEQKFNPDLQVTEYLLGEIAKAAEAVLGTLGQVLDAQSKASQAADQASSVQSKLADQTQKLVDAYNAANKAQITAADLSGSDAKSTQLLAAAKAALAAQNGTTGGTFDDLANHIQGAEKAMVKHADAVAKAGDAYDNLKDSANTDLQDIADQFTSKMATIQDAIGKTQQSITDLTAAYNATQASDTENVANKIVASQQKIADITTQLQGNITDSERTRLQEQLQDEQANYASSLSFRQAHVDEINAAEAEAAKTDLQRTIDTYNKKEDKDTADYNKKLKILQDTLADQQAEAQKEIDLTQEKITKIGGFLDTAQTAFIKQSNDRVAQTTAEVNAEIAMYNALAAAISRAKAGTTSGAVSSIVPKVTAVNDAIITPSGDIVQTDPADYLIATKTPGSLLGSSSVGGGATVINVTIAGGNYLDSQGAAMIATELAKQINRSIKVRNYAS